MNVVRRIVPAITTQSSGLMSSVGSQLQQHRGIRVQVRNGNLEQALAFMQRKMQSTGTERLIRSQQPRHIKNSEKRVLARKELERRLRSQEFAKNLKTILGKKLRGQ
ncbi:OLC1v1005887C1 [Oldenlandia corymbosa var. corymbosa]|uniref:OLC1v1005887C1 n=1 Tax=Oldenlandia corymbosa var. corymbosa TaxID=529605 RepID=A0AAV1DGC4_OLDCO|nr:OLC1v1005887C1 [Oldenlandia corymbosa var. corymbosa]